MLNRKLLELILLVVSVNFSVDEALTIESEAFMQ